GGVLLFGPPGCGKTLLARATAGECGLPFYNVRIEQIIDPFLGVSERNLHVAFEQARAAAPCVLFLDEIDALGFARSKHVGTSIRPLVDQLLQELDSIGADNRNILILAATNAPWDVDEALLRPGRFDRRIFVPPPDEQARRSILEVLLRSVPTDDVDTKTLAAATPLFSGADLRAVVEHATDEAIEEALMTEREPPVTGDRLLRAADGLHPTTVDWLAKARNYVEFANVGDRYGEIGRYLRSKEVRRRLG
ncbi:MAG: 26S protease regulatory subunit, partial [Actinomycetota bacterium]